MMPTAEDFLEIIRANPDDDVPKLVYADWLDDQSDKRGELIRLLIEVRVVLHDHHLWDHFTRSVRRHFGTAEKKTLLKQLDDRQKRLFACDCAESVLHYFKEYPDKYRKFTNALVIARMYANGAATEADLAIAEMTACGLAATLTFDDHFLSTCKSADAYDAASVISAATEENVWPATSISDRGQQLIWLVERLLKFNID